MRLAACFLVAAILAAGCSSPSGGGPSTSTAPAHVDAGTYIITLEGFPVGPVAGGSNLTFRDRITGSVQAYSDHIGAHFGSNSTDAPSTTAYNMTCAHSVGNLPGVYDVTCSVPRAPGLYHLRGHARIMQDGTPVNWWSAEQTFTVA